MQHSPVSWLWDRWWQQPDSTTRKVNRDVEKILISGCKHPAVESELVTRQL